MTKHPRFFDAPAGSFFLFGPRGTGKTSWVRSRYPDARFVDLLDPASRRNYAARPERLEEVLSAEAGPRTVVIDEAQLVPELLRVVHRLIEEKRGLRFVLLGSSARKLRRQGVDLLAGRAAERSLHPFLAAEMGSDFRLDEALSHGMVPLVVDAPEPGEVLRSYVSLYVDQEVRTEGWVRDVGSFSRFLEAVSFSHGAPINLSSVARECEVRRSTVAGYLEVLVDMLLAFQLPVFSRRAGRSTVSHPKFYFFDAGVYRSLRPRGPLDRPEEIEGATLEGLVAQHLRAWNAYRGERNQLSYWRTRSGSEVDLVIYGEDGFFAVEVKNSTILHPADLRGLKSFGDDYPEAQRMLLYRGTETRDVDGIRCVPCEVFLRALSPEVGHLHALT
ncbi:MAG: DUF4143 domain-containing protein [Candidatus Eisenbacteria bacterium]